MIQAMKLVFGMLLMLWFGMAHAGEYLLGSGYVLSVQVYGHTELEVDAVQVALEGPSKVSDLLAMAGGINPTWADTVILIHNQNGVEVQTPIDTLAVYKGQQLNLDDAVKAGDIIYVPRA